MTAGFGWQAPRVAVGFEDGVIRGNRIASRISQAVAAAMKTSRLTRAEIAEAMTAELGYAISVDILEKYASESAEGHRIPLERFLALISVTGCHDLLGFVAAPFGFAVVPERYTDIIELHLIAEHERLLAEHKAVVAARLRARG